MTAALRQLRAADAPDGEVTVYVKGFLGRGEKADHFERWLACHSALETSHAWGSGALGYHWPSGSLLPPPVAALGLAKSVFDVARLARGWRRSAALRGLGFVAAEELALIAFHFVHQYWAASRSARSRADEQAACLRELAERHRRVRVVAHSLGCRHVLEAAAQLPPELRPHEIHLCAPACREDEVQEQLDDLARERTLLYYTRKDRLLDLAFTPLVRGRALGFCGPQRPYRGLHAVDVSPHFEFWVHGEYKNRFARLVPPELSSRCAGSAEAASPRTSRPPP